MEPERELRVVDQFGMGGWTQRVQPPIAGGKMMGRNYYYYEKCHQERSREILKASRTSSVLKNLGRKHHIARSLTLRIVPVAILVLILLLRNS